MIFARAKNRDKLRKEHTRSDWLFERANDRKRHQKLLTDAEWYNRRSFSKHCDDDGCKTIDEVSQFFNFFREFYLRNTYLAGCSALRCVFKKEEETSKIQRQRLQTRGDWTFEVFARV